jgi:hypothetical protein
MDVKQTVKYVAFHQVLATAAAVVGLGIIGVGAWLGFSDAAQIVLNDAPQNWGDAVAAADPTTFAVLAVVGVLVWQVGKTLALVATVGRVAADTGGGDSGVSPAEVKRAVLSDVNDRISSVESDVKRHEEAISKAASRSNDASAGASESASRRSQRRGTGSTEDGRGGDGASSTDGDGAGESGGRESNRKSNRRTSRASKRRESDAGDEDAN